MSVNWFELSFQIDDLKISYGSFANFIKIVLEELKNSLQHDFALLTNHLHAQLKNKNLQLAQYKQNMQRMQTTHQKEVDNLEEKIYNFRDQAQKFKAIAAQKDSKLNEAMENSKKCEGQFVSLMEEMQEIKGYLSELQTLKREAGDFEEQERVLQHTQSLENLEKRTSSLLLDTIKEVTESVHSEMESSDMIEEYSHIVDTKTQSFECTSQVHDMNKIIFDQSRGKQNHPISQSYIQSLNFLKNYGNAPEQKKQEPKQFRIQLPKIENLTTPTLISQNIVTQQHILFQDGYSYIGKTAQSVNLGERELMPMGFGQLYYNGNMVYCGEWKNGLFDGWGKLFFDDNSGVKEFNGRMSKGVPCGPGKLKFEDGGQFVGNFENGQINGQGTYKNNEKGTRWGSWKKNCLIQQS